MSDDQKTNAAKGRLGLFGVKTSGPGQLGVAAEATKTAADANDKPDAKPAPTLEKPEIF